MTSENEPIKTNEFLRRRKLRLQQVREQSKEIAKAIRQRAKVEKSKHFVDLHDKKGKEYLQHQDKLVKKLEELYTKSLENVGAGHRDADNLKQKENTLEKPDLSLIRGKEAITELRRKKQELFDEKRKLLERKLQAREAANEISREKSINILNKFMSKPPSKPETEVNPAGNTPIDLDRNQIEQSQEPCDTNHDGVKKSDMATQWESDGLLNEWQPNVPSLLIPQDGSAKDSINNVISDKSEKTKRTNLFAISSDMPSSLCGGNSSISNENVLPKPSLNLVSEYLQNRGLRLRETDTTGYSKRHNDDLQSIKQTIQRTRASKTQVRSSFVDKRAKSGDTNSALDKKKSVMTYNHVTKDSRYIPCSDEKLVVRDLQDDTDDAYSKAVKQTSIKNTDDKQYQKIMQDMRSKIAMTKQNVEKEYKDTMTFLNSLPKKINKPTKDFCLSDKQDELKAKRQQKLQEEFKKIEKEHRKHNTSTTRSGSNSPIKRRSSSKSPSKQGIDEYAVNDFQYSWMPVPESDNSLAVHTIPTTLKEGRQGNTVKFSKVDSYHEYRSRHKHTPPTKDTDDNQGKVPKKQIETVLIQQESIESTEYSSDASDTSSVDNLKSSRDKKTKVADKELSGADKIIIYKVLDGKSNKDKSKRKIKSSKTTKKLGPVELNQNQDHQEAQKSRSINPTFTDSQSLNQINEGVYKVNENGDNITSMYFSEHIQEEGEKILLTDNDLKYGRPCCCSKQMKNPQERATNLSWKSGDNSEEIRKANTCLGCNCGCADSVNNTSKQKDSQNTVPQTSAATSASSFKTASNDRGTNSFPDEGCIKLMEEGGEETGKFYIGASGFLKDNAYEVIIQLKKKDSKEDTEKKHEKGPLKNISSNGNKDHQKTEKKSLVEDNVSTIRQLSKQSQIDFETITPILRESNNQSSNGEIRDYLSSRTLPDTGSRKISVHKTLEPKNANITSGDSNYKNSEEEIVSSWNPEDAAACKPAQNFVDKAVHTTFQMSYAIADHVTKADSTLKPGTSVCTQTSINSPRPTIVYMSSSTSTAYMSPPDLVLPRYLRKNSLHKERHSAEIDLTDQCEEYADCTSRRCKHAKKVMCSKKTKYSNHKLYTPPNTARTLDSSSRGNKNSVSSSSQPAKKLKCRKCESRTGIKTCNWYKNNLSKTRSRTVKSTSSGTYKAKTTKFCPEKETSTLNPIIKNYVNKLLALNKENLKAIEVINQECSSVATPGSSIINLPSNKVNDKPFVEHKISLEQVKNLLKQQILENFEKLEKTNTISGGITDDCTDKMKPKFGIRNKRSLHKVKSLNISKQLLKVKHNSSQRTSKNAKMNIQSSTNSSFKDDSSDKKPLTSPSKIKPRRKTSPFLRLGSNNTESKRENIRSETAKVTINNKNRKMTNELDSNCEHIHVPNSKVKSKHTSRILIPSHRSTLTSTSTGVDSNNHTNSQEPVDISTQTSRTIDTEINFIKLAEDKLENMDKIADLTEKCTKRLSDLAKVLEEVRRNKSMAYCQLSTSDSASDSDQKLDRNKTIVSQDLPVLERQSNITAETNNNITALESYRPICDTQINKLSVQSNVDIQKTKTNFPLSTLTQEKIFTETDTSPSLRPPTTKELNTLQYTSILSDLPKPVISKLPTVEPHNVIVDTVSLLNDGSNIKIKRKPPPALSRAQLKFGQEFTVPHELSTVLEVDSPMSVKHRAPSVNKSNTELDDSVNDNLNNDSSANIVSKKGHDNLDILQGNIFKQKINDTVNTSDESKIQMIDMKRFNEIMLKPFISVDDYAKQCNIGSLDEGSNLDDVSKDYVMNDDISSLHSDGSLPDVIAELLKRNLINEPFKYDTASNVNSTTYSSESSLSVLALSKARKDKKKSTVTLQNKENIAETSDTLSISSNPDLEKAFKNLGMGWASSTLKKTKERLALSSSSNSSNSSLSRKIKLKSFLKQDIPAVTDSISSTLHLSKKANGKDVIDVSKNVEQQTSISNSMTVKEFLNNELAKKITFTNKSDINYTDEEFVSLYETKLPEEIKHSTNMVLVEKSADSTRSGDNRARTSTPVQIYKSPVYHSSSSSNLSNGLFSNADDLSSVKGTSNSIPNHSTSDKDDLTIPNLSLKMKKSNSECSKSD